MGHMARGLLAVVACVLAAHAAAEPAVAAPDPWRPHSEDLYAPRQNRPDRPHECDKVICNPKKTCAAHTVPAPSIDWIGCCFDAETDCIKEPTKERTACDNAVCPPLLLSPSCPPGELTKPKSMWRGCCFDIKYDCTNDFAGPAPAPSTPALPKARSGDDCEKCPPMNNPPCDNPRLLAKPKKEWLSCCFHPETDCMTVEREPMCDQRQCPDVVPYCGGGRKVRPRVEWADCCFNVKVDCVDVLPPFSEQTVDGAEVQQTKEEAFELPGAKDSKYQSAVPVPVPSADFSCTLPPPHVFASSKKIYVTDSPHADRNVLIGFVQERNMVDMVEDSNTLGGSFLEMDVFVSNLTFVPTGAEILATSSLDNKTKCGIHVKKLHPVDGAFSEGWNKISVPIEESDYVNPYMCSWHNMAVVIIGRSGPATGVVSNTYLKIKNLQVRKVFCPPRPSSPITTGRQCADVSDTAWKASSMKKVYWSLSGDTRRSMSFPQHHPFSISAWYAPSAGGDFGGTIISKWDETVRGEYVLAVDRTGYVTFVRSCEGCVLRSPLPLPRALGSLSAKSIYTHIAAVYDGDEMRMYLNGTLVGRVLSGDNHVDTQTGVLVGASLYKGAPARYLNGRLDELHVWNYARSRTGILEEMFGTWKQKASTGLVAAFDFNEGAGGSASNIQDTSNRIRGSAKGGNAAFVSSAVPCHGVCAENCNGKNGLCSVNGSCICRPGFSGGGCAKKSCPAFKDKVCSGRGDCFEGYCRCHFGFEGSMCERRVCAKGCEEHGICLYSGKCSCDQGFKGLACEKGDCPFNCHGHGKCVRGFCKCESAWTGPLCAESVCEGNCSNHGACNGKTKNCSCDPHWGGDICQFPLGPKTACVADCFNHGQCLGGKCQCDDDHTGEFCKDLKCPGDCSGHGKCRHGECVCDKYFDSKIDCSVKLYCPKQCSGHGSCIDGECHCKMGFCGLDCGQNNCPSDPANGLPCGGHSQGRCTPSGCSCMPGFSGKNCGFKEGWPFKCVTVCGDSCETKCLRSLKPAEDDEGDRLPTGEYVGDGPAPGDFRGRDRA